MWVYLFLVLALPISLRPQYNQHAVFNFFLFNAFVHSNKKPVIFKH